MAGLKFYALTAAAGLVFLILLAGAGIYGFGWDGKFARAISKIVPYPALVVDWEPVRYHAFLEELAVVERYWQNQNQNSNVSLPISEKSEIKSLLLKKIIESKIIQIFARQNGLFVNTEEVEEQWQKLTASPELKNNVDDFLERAYGGSGAQFKERVLKNYLLRQKVAVFLGQENGLSEEQLLAKGRELAAKIRRGEDFGMLASAYSDDAATKASAGQTGYFAVGSWPPPLEKAILELKVGEASEPIAFNSAYYIFKLEDALYNDRQEPAQINVRQIVLKGFDFSKWLEEQKQALSIYRLIR